MALERTLITYIEQIIKEQTIWLRHYIGKIIEINDPENKGKVLVYIYDLMMHSTDSFSFWCVPRDKNALSTPKIDDWVEVYFLNGDKNRPVYIGIANEMKDMLPRNYDGVATTHVIFESPNNKIHMKYDEASNICELGNSNFLEAARKTDTIRSTSSEDAVFWLFIDNLVAVFNAHTHSGVTTGGGVSGTTATPLSGKPTQLAGVINSGSTQVKIGGA